MARPTKQTVVYFPHDTDASVRKTLTIMQSKYGNDGYACWFKLLELLGSTPGMHFDYRNPADLEFLCAKTHQKDTETVLSMLFTLATIGAIDQELYEKGIIWSQKLVDGVADAFKRTTAGKPQKPVIVGSDVVSADNMHTETPKTHTESAQIKLNKSKLNKEINKEKKKDDTLRSAKKDIHGEFENVHLLPSEKKKLDDKFTPSGASERIEKLSAGIASKGYKYKSHYAAILSWDRKDQSEGRTNGRTKGNFGKTATAERVYTQIPTPELDRKDDEEF